MKHQFRFRKEKIQEQAEEHLLQTEKTVRDFSSVEELLQEDAAQISVPENLEKRVSVSLAEIPEKSWWHRLRGNRK